MNLSESDAKLFYELMWPLQFFVNQKLKIFPSIRSLENYVDLPQDKKFKCREALYDNPELIHDYISMNPNNLNDDKFREPDL